MRPLSPSIYLDTPAFSIETAAAAIWKENFEDEYCVEASVKDGAVLPSEPLVKGHYCLCLAEAQVTFLPTETKAFIGSFLSYMEFKADGEDVHIPLHYDALYRVTVEPAEGSDRRPEKVILSGGNNMTVETPLDADGQLFLLEQPILFAEMNPGARAKVERLL